MDNMTISKKTIQFAEDITFSVTFGGQAGRIDKKLANTSAALIALGVAAAHTKIIIPMRLLRFNGKGMNGFFKDICFKIKTFGDDEAKALVSYAESHFNPKARFNDGMYGVVTQFSFGVTYYRDEFKGESLAQWTYFYEDKNGRQFISDISIGA